MTNLAIPDSVPARAGASGASANDLSNRHQSATLNMATGEVVSERKGIVKADSANRGAGSSVFSKVQSSSGTIEDAKLDTIVSGPSIPGDGVRLRDALAAGFVHKNEDGSYSAGPGTFGEKPDDKKADDDKADKGDTGDGEAMSSEIEGTLNTLIEGSSSDDQLAAVHQVAEGGEVSPELIASVAQEMGIKPEDLQGQVGSVIDGFETQARDAMTKATGIDSQRILEWVWEHKMPELNKAMIEQGTQRSTAGYAALAREYLADLDTIDPDSILSANFSDDITARRDERGNVVITVNGQEHPWKSAVRAGLLSIK